MYYHRVLRADGSVVGTIGPTDMLMKTNEADDGWVLFQGGGLKRNAYVPRNLYRLTVGAPDENRRPAFEVVESFSKSETSTETVKLDVGPIQRHMIALLTPQRTARRHSLEDDVVDFCPTTPASRAQYLLGEDYDDRTAAAAVSVLMDFWRELSPGNTTTENPINRWFESEIAADESIAALVTPESFNPTSAEWSASFQRRLASRAGSTLDRLVEQYGPSGSSRTRGDSVATNPDRGTP